MVENDPFGHSIQEDIDDALELAATVVENVPLGQKVQEDDPTVEEYVPFWHG